MDYIKEGSTLPVPFNLIPTVESFYKIFTQSKDSLKRKLMRKNNFQTEEIEFRNGGLSSFATAIHQAVINNVILKYFYAIYSIF
jgi:hypothetical protein